MPHGSRRASRLSINWRTPKLLVEGTERRVSVPDLDFTGVGKGIKRDFHSPEPGAGVGGNRWFKSRARNHPNRFAAWSRQMSSKSIGNTNDLRQRSLRP